VQQTSPALIDWLYDYARMAVQVFFVISGYLAARSMFSNTGNMTRLTTNLINRYLRLVIPFFFALVLAIVCAFVARQLLADDFIPAAPELLQILSHVFLLHGVLDFDSLSAGAWFIAVDFQLFMMMLGIAWLGGRAIDSRKIVLVMVTLMAAASLFWFNRHAGYDDWALYFFGAYGMGAMAYWAGQREQQAAWLWLNVAIALASLFVDFRLRILIAVCVALMLFYTRNMQIKEGFKLQKIVHYLGTISYALFLVHFSVVMLANAIFGWFKLSDSLTSFVFMLFSWLASLVLADIFYRRIEKPIISVIKLSVSSR
jgi:peptidoglycan/LPS O-acetylase OafA/YrhL